MGQGEPLGDEVAEMDPQGEQSQSDPGGIWRGIGRLAEELEEVVENLRETAGKEVRKWRDPFVGRRSEFPRRRGSWREGKEAPNEESTSWRKSVQFPPFGKRRIRWIGAWWEKRGKCT